jgi:hypothetical protein
MRHYFASWVVVLSAISCGGTSETSDSSNAGSSAGGSSSGASSHAGSATGGSAGQSSGGSSSAGSGSAGSSSAGNTTGGTLGISGSTGQAGTATGGTGVVDPDCPAIRPMGTCDDAGTSCQYDYTNCLGYPTAPGTFTPCQKVDPACTGVVQAAPFEGTGGISAKVALPPRQVCTCSAGNWMCAFGG